MDSGVLFVLYVLLVSIVITAMVIAIVWVLLWAKRNPKPQEQLKPDSQYDWRGFDSSRMHRNGTKYDDAGFDYYGYNASGFGQHGYNAFGKNVQGQYNRFFDTTSGAEEGFYPVYRYPIALTDHVQLRMVERLHINNTQQMRMMAANAYQFGKSKRQLKRSSAALIHEIEQRHENGIILLYRNHIYVFSRENVLITVYKNERIPL